MIFKDTIPRILIFFVIVVFGNRFLSADDGNGQDPTLKLSPSRTDVCIYGNQTYSPGERFRPNPCTSCHCSKHGGRPLCAVHDCAYEPSCIRRDRRKDECCGRCLEYGCLHSDGKVYPPGSIISDTNCKKCICTDNKDDDRADLNDVVAGASAVVVCRKKFVCPEVACVDPIIDPERNCCRICPNGENCWHGDKILSAGKLIKVEMNEGEGRMCKSCFCPPILSIPFWRRSKGIEAVCSATEPC